MDSYFAQVFRALVAHFLSQIAFDFSPKYPMLELGSLQTFTSSLEHVHETLQSKKPLGDRGRRRPARGGKNLGGDRHGDRPLGGARAPLPAARLCANGATVPKIDANSRSVPVLNPIIGKHQSVEYYGVSDRKIVNCPVILGRIPPQLLGVGDSPAESDVLRLVSEMTKRFQNRVRNFRCLRCHGGSDSRRCWQKPCDDKGFQSSAPASHFKNQCSFDYSALGIDEFPAQSL